MREVFSTKCLFSDESQWQLNFNIIFLEEKRTTGVFRAVKKALKALTGAERKKKKLYCTLFLP